MLGLSLTKEQEELRESVDTIIRERILPISERNR
jgi:hypothetical protein